jgi:hypothetical protein
MMPPDFRSFIPSATLPWTLLMAVR